ncbi:hypothetical protein CKO_03738 [Citrobacter koseri ATCC BAA-895]|uniref:Uncharacterized protein n=1 Tax=Citrobacter koseri (strain ATCC BAA-895 / CDC 4225-83 / SGSC4696) TaxID=290338 RepID=A8AMV0_CITK8|nr:hypothetical protein CKO_03738 [Citrobacter koseri ATCC BAA-895]
MHQAFFRKIASGSTLVRKAVILRGTASKNPQNGGFFISLHRDSQRTLFFLQRFPET